MRGQNWDVCLLRPLAKFQLDARGEWVVRFERGPEKWKGRRTVRPPDAGTGRPSALLAYLNSSAVPAGIDTPIWRNGESLRVHGFPVGLSGRDHERSEDSWARDCIPVRPHMSTSEEKIRVLKDSIREEPDDPLGYYLLGMECAKLRRHLDAIDAFERAIRINPDYTAAYRELGKSLRDAGRRHDAVDILGQGVVVAERTHDVQTMKQMLVFLKRLNEERL